jgi:large subunit ribosomal protein L3
VQLGYKIVREKNIKKPEIGHCTKAGTPLLRHLKEFKVKNADQLEGMDVGKEIDMSELFSKGDVVDCSGMSIGKGFQGNIKRWGHRRGLMTHGAPLSPYLPFCRL